MDKRKDLHELERQKIIATGEKMGEAVGEAAYKAGEVVGDVSKVTLEASKVVIKTVSAFAGGLKKGFRNNW